MIMHSVIAKLIFGFIAVYVKGTNTFLFQPNPKRFYYKDSSNLNGCCYQVMLLDEHSDSNFDRAALFISEVEDNNYV